MSEDLTTTTKKQQQKTTKKHTLQTAVQGIDSAEQISNRSIVAQSILINVEMGFDMTIQGEVATILLMQLIYTS